PIANTYVLSDEIKKMVHFQEANLMDATRLAALGKFDIAFCRNVLIYFDEASKEKVLMNIYNAIADDGTLLLGHSENIYSQRHIFKQDKQRTAAIAYTKQPPGTPKHTV
ncbi:MAG: chemotaxis protein, partial [Alphaproteobacteria bacterium]|nr:chemotaxis protein [Alphaproteobacteria bacterium]